MKLTSSATERPFLNEQDGEQEGEQNEEEDRFSKADEIDKRNKMEKETMS